MGGGNLGEIIDVTILNDLINSFLSIINPDLDTTKF